MIATHMQAETVRIIRASVLGSIAILPILILPTLVGALIDHAFFTEAQAGWVVTVGFAGGALGAIAIGLRIQHLDPRRLAVFGMLTLAIFDALSMLVNQVPVWLFLSFRFLSGIGGVAAYAAVMATIAASNNPERGYGIFMVFQFGISAVGLYALPLVLPDIRVFGLFLAMAATAALALVFRKSVMQRAERVEDAVIELHMIMKPAAILAMFGIGFYETANFMQFTYAERIGITFGLPDSSIGEILGFASLLGIPAALVVVGIGDRFGQLRPLLFALFLSIAAIASLLYPTGTATYVTSMLVLGFAWSFGLAFFYALEARLDPGGSVVVVGGFFTSIGSVFGPALAATLVTPDGYARVLVAAIAVYSVVICLATLSVRVAARR